MMRSLRNRLSRIQITDIQALSRKSVEALRDSKAGCLQSQIDSSYGINDVPFSRDDGHNHSGGCAISQVRGKV